MEANEVGSETIRAGAIVTGTLSGSSTIASAIADHGDTWGAGESGDESGGD